MEVKRWNILYRGSLDSCNYDCHYCPFAKKKNTREELAQDKRELAKFVNWVKTRNEEFKILITPWGEGLIRKYYQEAMTELSHLPHVKKIAIQTNLSCSTKWMSEVNKGAFALWITYHPKEIKYEKFLSQIHAIQALNINFSIGVVGVKEHFEGIEQLKQDLPNEYIWVNAYKREPDYYSQEEINWLTKMDQLFPINNQVYETKGKPCSAGETSFSVNHKGDVFPCHFIKNKLGNIYEHDILDLLKPSNCTVSECRCYIGYINLKELALDDVYGEQILERIPQTLK